MDKTSGTIGVIFATILYLIQTVSAHAGHPEEQIVNGIDNGILIFLVMGFLTTTVIVFAWYKGKQVRLEMEQEGKPLK